MLKWIFSATGVAAVVGLIVGIVLGLPVADKMDQVFTTNEFCGQSCHVMEAAASQLAESPHGTTTTGVVPGCRDCHVADTLTKAMFDHFRGLHDVYSYVIKGIDTPEEFEEVRVEGANRVRMRMVANDSENCRNCHVLEKIVPEKKRGQKQHAEAQEKGITCIVCHYDLVHEDAEPSEEFDAVIGQY